MNVEFLILYALILSITLNIMYFIRKHINSNEAKIFSKILFSNLLGLMLELMCIYMSNKFSPTSLPAIIFTRAYLIYFIFSPMLPSQISAIRQMHRYPLKTYPIPYIVWISRSPELSILSRSLFTVTDNAFSSTYC